MNFIANQRKITKHTIKLSLLVIFGICFSFCKGQKSESMISATTDQKKVKNVKHFKTNSAVEIDQSIRSVFQDKKGDYWFGTNAAGVYRYDGNTLQQFTDKDGVSNNQVQSIQEDKFGNIWFGTGLFSITRFDGKNFTPIINHFNDSSVNNWKIDPDDLFFNAGAGVFQYSNNSVTYLPLAEDIHKSGNSQNSPFTLSPYAVYSILKDKKGNLWFGTQAKGVCRYDGTAFTWFTEKGLSGPAVLSLFEDNKGNIWIGNNGSGLFRYDGKLLINFTEEKGLSNNEFRVSGKSVPGTLARIYSINEDSSGNLWIGTVDSGVWKYDGNLLTNYTTKDGLSSNAVNTIYKDRKGELWFGTDENGICKFNGKTFWKFVTK